MIAVLLVEDNPGDVVLTRTALQEGLADQFGLAEVACVSEAVERLRHHRVDLVLLDLSLPDAEGLQAFEAIRKAAPDVPIVVLSGSQDQALALKAVVEGAQDFVNKSEANGPLLARVVRYAIGRMKAEERLRRVTQFDLLTGLPNRTEFRNRVVEAAAHASRERPLAVLVVNVNRFRRFNESLGYDTADRLLRLVAERIETAAGNRAAATRLSGDEFGVVAERCDRQDAARLADEIIAAFGDAFLVKGQRVGVSVRVGVALAPFDAGDYGGLLRTATRAMRTARQLGGSARAFAQPDEAGETPLSIEQALREAIEHGRLLLHYQPVVHLATGKVIAMEAFVRWNHAEQGILTPESFLGVAEESGLIHPLGRWVLREACQQARAWRDRGLPPWRLVVNVAPQQLLTGAFPGEVAQALADAGLAPPALQIDLPESTLLTPLDSQCAVVAQLKGLGVRIALDRFGSGHASLAHVKKLPIDTLKIDREYVAQCVHDQVDGNIVKSVIAMAHSLHITVVASGVETQDQAGFLTASRCDAAQGRLYGPPLTAESIDSFARDATRVA